MDTVDVQRSKMSHGKINWKSGPAMYQNFPLPDTLIYYMIMNPSSPEIYQKLIQTCKYFFEVNPILVVRQMCELLSEYKISGKTRICSNEHLSFSPVDDVCCVHIDLEKTLSKIWLLECITIEGNDCPNFTSILLHKLYRCEIGELFVYDAKITFHDFKVLAQFVKELWLMEVIVFDHDGKAVLLDKILEVCPKIEKISCLFNSSNDSMLSAATLKDILKLQNLSNLKEFEMDNVPEILNIQDISDFVTKNFLETKITFCFDVEISEEYQSQLEAIREKFHKLQIQNHYIVY